MSAAESLARALERPIPASHVIDAWSSMSGGLIERVGWTLLNSIWQFTLLTVIYLIAGRFLVKRSPQARYLAGLLTLGAMFTVSSATFLAIPRDSAVVVSVVEPARQHMHLAEGNENGVSDATRRGVLTVEEDRPRLPGEELPRAGSESAIAANVGASRGFLGASLARAGRFVRPWLSLVVGCWIVGTLVASIRPGLGWLTVCRLRSSGTVGGRTGHRASRPGRRPRNRAIPTNAGRRPRPSRGCNRARP